MTDTDITQRANLVTLGDSDLTVAEDAEDIRGRTVLDRDGEEIGKVDALLIDDREAKVRFLRIGSGGFLGIGKELVVIPVDAITRIDDDHVHIDQGREHVAGARRYNPDLVSEQDYWEDVYGHYGYAPYWSVGYAYPAYPYYVF